LGIGYGPGITTGLAPGLFAAPGKPPESAWKVRHWLRLRCFWPRDVAFLERQTGVEKAGTVKIAVEQAIQEITEVELPS
jgi:hypothetical protein